MTKQELFEYLQANPASREKCEASFKILYPDLYAEFLAFTFDDDLNDKPFKQRLWHFLQNDCGETGHCLVCGKRTRLITFAKGYNRFCCSTCSNKSQETKQKLRETISGYSPEKRMQINEKCEKTCKDRYGGIGFASDELKEKYESVMQEKYGAKHNFLVPEIIEKRDRTWQVKYGTDNPMKNKDVSKKTGDTQKSFTEKRKFEKTEKSKKTRKLRYGDENYTNRKKAARTCKAVYGHESAMQAETCKRKLASTVLEKTKNKYPFILDYDGTRMICSCMNPECGKCEDRKFETTYDMMKYREKHNIEQCTKIKAKSGIENEIYDYIHDIYHGVIIRNDRKTLNGKEFDVFLPELKLAFEVNGDFWHLNPSLYDENYEYKGRTVESEKRRRDEKTRLAESKGIELMHIWQHAWITDRESAEKRIKDAIINKRKNGRL